MMADFSIKTGKRLGIYASVLGVICLLVGLVEIFGGSGEVIPGDIFGGFVLVVMAVTYLNGVIGVSKGRHEGLSFLIGGLFLTSVFGVLCILIMGADGLMYLLGEAEELPKLIDARPEIWIFILSLPLVQRVRNLTEKMTW
jgi:hypothetical protein